MICAHLHNCNLTIWFNTQQCKWHSNVIIEISLCILHTIFSTQYSRHQLFSRSLAICASDTHNRNTQLLTMITSQLLQCIKHIINQNHLRMNNSFIINHCKHTPLLYCRHSKFITIESLSLQCKKYRPFRAITAIGCNHRMNLINLI